MLKLLPKAARTPTRTVLSPLMCTNDGPNPDVRDKRFDADSNGEVSRKEFIKPAAMSERLPEPRNGFPPAATTKICRLAIPALAILASEADARAAHDVIRDAPSNFEAPARLIPSIVLERGEGKRA